MQLCCVWTYFRADTGNRGRSDSHPASRSRTQQPRNLLSGSHAPKPFFHITLLQPPHKRPPTDRNDLSHQPPAASLGRLPSRLYYRAFELCVKYIYEAKSSTGESQLRSFCFQLHETAADLLMSSHSFIHSLGVLLFFLISVYRLKPSVLVVH